MTLVEFLGRAQRNCLRQVVALDAHSGIGISNVMDLMTEVQVNRSKRYLSKHGANVKE